MKMPSIGNLTKNLGISENNAVLIRRIANAVDDPLVLQALVNEYAPKTRTFLNRTWIPPYEYRSWRVTIALRAMDEILDTNGVESLGPGNLPPYRYLNTGDPYRPTLIYKRKSDAVVIGAWGDIAEKHPNW